MEIRVQYFEGCPNVGLVRDRLAELGVDPAGVRFETVASPEDAERVGFHGSPTVLIDGEDPFEDGSAPVGFACRVYRNDAGAEGAPSLAQLRAALDR